MTKKRVLMCTEASFLPTGYSVYTKEVLSRLNDDPELEVAELSCYTTCVDKKFLQIPWKAYANKPHEPASAIDEYNSHQTNAYGEFTFNTVCLDFKPDFVMDIRDPWVFEFQTRSPFRKFFNHVIMPTVDSEPQNPEWIDMFAGADGVFTYSDFGFQSIINQSNSVNLLGIAPPCASDDFHVIHNKEANKLELSIPNDLYVIGTVMRNQRRKLYPELFKLFREFLETTKREDVILYCHTNFPDVGWDIPQLLMEYNLSNKVLFTYKCLDCSTITSSFFKDHISQCKKCGNFSETLAGIGNPLSDSELNKVYNCFHVYIQYANSEGFGMPQLEAAKAGNIVASVNYSAMKSIIDTIEAYPIRVLHYLKECETGCYRAIPDNKDCIRLLNDFVNRPMEALYAEGAKLSEVTNKCYNWDNTAKEWAEYFKNTQVQSIHNTWLSPIKRPIDPPPLNHSLKNPTDRATFLVSSVLGKPELVGSLLWRRIIKDLTYGKRLHSMDDFYFNEHQIKDHLHTIKFNYEDAYKEMLKLKDYYDLWETNRAEFLGSRSNG